jgi:acyl-CoA synthetase (AMP-forming)/AMP-acid ligase II
MAGDLDSPRGSVTDQSLTNDAVAHALPPSLPRISDFVSYHADRTPEAEALVLGERRISYRQLRENVDALARALLAAGVGKGDRVATLCTPSPDYFIIFLATASIGAIWAGLNPRYRLDELEFVIGDAEPVLLFARTSIEGRDYAADLVALRAGHPCIRDLIILDKHRVPKARSYAELVKGGESISHEELQTAREASGGRDPCMIVYTSGSTGRPNGALLHHEGIVGFSLAQNCVWPVNPLRTLNYFPINHIGCVVDVSTPTLVAGGTIVFLEQFSPADALRLIEHERVTLWGSVPTVFQWQLMQPDFPGWDLSAVQLIVWEGATMPRETLTRLLEIGPPLATNYGLTESCGAITVIEPTRDLELLSRSVGPPFPGVDIRITDGEGADVADGAEGEVRARSAFNMLGYWNDKDATSAALKDGWLATGDLGRRNPDGSITLVGRAKEMFKSGGYNVYPREVENVLESHEAVEMAAVVPAPDPLWDEVGVAYVALRSPLSTDALLSYCRDRLANYKIPKTVVMVDQLPLLPIGKVDKVTLKTWAAADHSACAAIA